MGKYTVRKKKKKKKRKKKSLPDTQAIFKLMDNEGAALFEERAIF